MPAAPSQGSAGSVLRLSINTSQPDAYSIIAWLEALTIQFGRDANVREFTARKVLCNTSNNDLQKVIRDIIWFVRSHLVYLPDPDGSEYVISPVEIITQLMNGGQPKGDCDDHVLLLNSMLLSVGVQCRVVGVSLFDPTRFDHVISSVYTGTDWQDVDPCNKTGESLNYLNRLVNQNPLP